MSKAEQFPLLTFSVDLKQQLQHAFKLRTESSGSNHGHGFNHYVKVGDLKRAIEKENEKDERPGYQRRTQNSNKQFRLLLGNIESLGVYDLNMFLRRATSEVSNVFLFNNLQELKEIDIHISTEKQKEFSARIRGINSTNQIAVVEYESHKAAVVARRVLIFEYGNILAIECAVSCREKTSVSCEMDSRVSFLERLVSCSVAKESRILFKPMRIKPVPTLLVLPSHLDNLPFLPKSFDTVVKFFRYQLRVCVIRSIKQLKISKHVCIEINKKIVSNIEHVENCSEAVQLILNYFSWVIDDKLFYMKSEVRKLLLEVKEYSDSIVFFLKRRLKHGPSLNDDYYIHVLPLQLNILWQSILMSDPEHVTQFPRDITRGLKWLMETILKDDKTWREFKHTVNLIKHKDVEYSYKAKTLAHAVLESLNFSSENRTYCERGNNLTGGRKNCSSKKFEKIK